MAIAYPRPMLDWIARASFDPGYLAASQPERGGRANSVLLGDATWRASFATLRLTPSRLGAARAWISSLQNGVKTFYGRDPARLYPLAYPTGFAGLERAGGGAFDGTATSWSIDATRSIVTINGLPASFPLAPGDMIGWSWSTTKRALARSLEAVVANGSGVAVVAVEPYLSTVVSGSAVLTLARPECVMKLVPGSYRDAEAEGPDGRAFISFSAIQHLD